MPYPTTPEDWISRLAREHDHEKPYLRRLNDEYELRSPKMYMHPDILRELGDRLQQVVIAWPMLVVDSLEERLDVEGFRLPDQDAGDKDLWRVWQENDLDEESQLAHIDALTMKRSYIAVGTNEEDADTPLVTFESPLEVFAEVDPRSRKVLAALRRYADTDYLMRTVGESGAPPVVNPGQNQYATLYLPAVTIHYEMGRGQWQEVDRDEHKLGVVPVVPLVNRSRLADRTGKSELSPILPLSHAANKIASDMMVAAEFVAIPLRGFLGLGPDALEDEQGNKMTAMQAILGRLLMIPEGGDAVKQFEFASAQLSNFHSTIDKLAALVASLAGMPPHYLGLTTDNPASADAIRSSEARLVKRAERRQRAFGGAHEQAMRLVKRFQEGDWDPRYRRLETVWRDASTPTVAQKADAALKLYNLPSPIVPKRQTREDLGYSDAQIARMEAEDQKQAADDLKMFQMESAAQATTTPADQAPAPDQTGGQGDTGQPADNGTPADSGSPIAFSD